jgi:hypothetical protein
MLPAEGSEGYQKQRAEQLESWNLDPASLWEVKLELHMIGSLLKRARENSVAKSRSPSGRLFGFKSQFGHVEPTDFRSELSISKTWLLHM